MPPHPRRSDTTADAQKKSGCGALKAPHPRRCNPAGSRLAPRSSEASGGRPACHSSQSSISVQSWFVMPGVTSLKVGSGNTYGYVKSIVSGSGHVWAGT